MTVVAGPPATGAPAGGATGSGDGDEATPSRRPGARPAARLVQAVRVAFAERLWPSGVLLCTLATLATATSSGGAYIGDNRFEQYWNPARRLARTLTVWDGSRGLGRVREDFWPATTAPLAILRGLGFSAPVAQALFHALLIGLAGLGTVALVRLFRRPIGLEHLLAGLFVSFGAYSATFLVPSNLYYTLTLTPWLLVVVFEGVHSGRPWRWAAVFAMLVFTAGNVDTPGLVYGFVPVIPLMIHAVLIERSARVRDVIGWFARAGVLTLLTSAAMVVKTLLGAQALAGRLNDTEAADVSAFTSSWSESVRGLGNWLSYFQEGGELLKPQGVPYFSNWLVVAATFVPPGVALYVLWQSRWRARLAFALMAVVSLVILVGAFPHADPSPFGEELLQAYTEVNALAAFRNTYKIGGGLAIGVAVLFAYGVMLAHRSLTRSNPGWRALPIIAAFATLAGVSFPFWTGQLYHPDQRMEDVPAYWLEAFDYLADLPDDGRSLVLPQTSRARYRWGWVGDDIFDALDSRDHAIATGVPLSTPVPANVLEAITVVASDPHYVPGTIKPLMQRLGLTEIVLRNDLDWQDLSRPRPSSFDNLRRDPDLRLAATFGRPGEHTARREDRSPDAERDRTYPPVEVWALHDPAGSVTMSSPGPPLVVSGDGHGWAALAQAGVLGPDVPIAFSAAQDAQALTGDLQAGAPLLVTDSNRRRLKVLVAHEADYSHTLSEGQDLDRPTQELWPTDGSQSVTWFPAGSSVHATGPARSVGGSQVWTRPANALDGDDTTAWTLRTLEEAVGRALVYELREPTEIGQAAVTQVDTNTPVGITRARLRFSDGSEVPIAPTARRTDVLFPPRVTDRVELIIDEVAPGVATIGVAELWVPGIDLTEYIQAPDDVFRRAESDPALAGALHEAPAGYAFSRSARATTQTNPLPVLVGAATTDEETSLRRRFRVAGGGGTGRAPGSGGTGAREFDVGGRLRLRPDVPDAVIDRFIGGDHGAIASHRHNGDLAAIGGMAVDGNPATAWLAPAQSGVTLTLRFPRQEVRHVDLSSRYDGVSSQLDRFQVETSDPASGRPVVHAREAEGPNGELRPSDPACDTAASPAPGCVRNGRVTLDQPVVTDHLTVRLTGVSGRAAAAGGRIRVDEAQVNGQVNGPLHQPDARPAPCLAAGLRIDGPGGLLAGPDALALTVDGTIGDLLSGRSVTFTACGRVRLGDGWHTLDSGPHAPFEQVHLLEPGLRERSAGRAPPTGSVRVEDRAPTEQTLRVTGNQPGSFLLFNQSYDGGWRATVNGVPLGRPRNLNGVNAWVLDQPGDLHVELRYNPRSLFGYAVPVTTGGLALCAYLALRRPRSERRSPPRRTAPATGGPDG